MPGRDANPNAGAKGHTKGWCASIQGNVTSALPAWVRVAATRVRKLGLRKQAKSTSGALLHRLPSKDAAGLTTPPPPLDARPGQARENPTRPETAPEGSRGTSSSRRLHKAARQCHHKCVEGNDEKHHSTTLAICSFIAAADANRLQQERTANRDTIDGSVRPESDAQRTTPTRLGRQPRRMRVLLAEVVFPPKSSHLQLAPTNTV